MDYGPSPVHTAHTIELSRIMRKRLHAGPPPRPAWQPSAKAFHTTQVRDCDGWRKTFPPQAWRNLPAAYARYQVREAPPSIHAKSKAGCAKKSHELAGSMIARFAKRIPFQPPVTFAAGVGAPKANSASHSSCTKVRGRV